MTKERDAPKLVFLLHVGLRSVERWLEGRPDRSPTLSSAQAGVLFYLGRHEGALIGEVAQALSIGASAMTGLANRMEQAGLILRHRSDADGRAIGLSLSNEGEIARQRALAGLAELNTKMTDGFTDAEIKTVARWLEMLSVRFNGEDDERNP